MADNHADDTCHGDLGDVRAADGQGRIVPFSPKLRRQQERQEQIRKAIKEQSEALGLHTPLFACPFLNRRIVPWVDEDGGDEE